MNKKIKLPTFVIFLFISFSTISQDTIFFQPGPLEGKDAIVHSLHPVNNYGASPNLIAAAWTYQGTFGKIRGLIKFDLTSLPVNMQIQSAYLNLYHNPTSGHEGHAGNNIAWISKITGNWDETTVNWNSQPSITIENQVTIPPSSNATQNYLEIPVTDIVQDMIENPDANNGFQIMLQYEEIYNSLIFASSDHPSSELWPMLAVIPECEAPVADFSLTIQGSTVVLTDESQNATSWLWDFGDGYQSTLVNPVHTYQETGNFIICLTVSNECGSDTKCDTVRIALTEIDNINIASQMILSPNPVSDVLSIQLPEKINSSIEVSVVNASGIIVYHQYETIVKENTIKISCTNLQPGIYFILIRDLQHNITKKFLIQ